MSGGAWWCLTSGTSTVWSGSCFRAGSGRVSCLTLVGGWLSTLLGPEGSAVWLVSSGPPSTCVPACVGVWGLVGLLFEICIVDASISWLIWFHGL